MAGKRTVGRSTFVAMAAFSLTTAAAGAALAQEKILFVGNSFTYGAMSPVWKYRSDTVTDLNNGGVGGVPALFKSFAEQAGLNYTVSLETVGGQGIDHHLADKKALIDKPWDIVVMHGFSTLDRDKPGDPTLLISTAGQAAQMFQARNPAVKVHLTSTWSRADQTYQVNSPWKGKPIEAMGQDIRKAYDLAAAASPHIRSVIPVGDAWNRAFVTGVADPNPYDGVEAGKVNLWTYDHYHGSTYGYYLEALMVFGRITGKDPTSLGPRERSAAELGLSPDQATKLQTIARDELAAYRGKGAS